MLSLFPSLLSLQLLAPLLLRLTLGIIFGFWALNKFKNSGGDARIVVLGILEVAVGILLIIGLFTQLAALVAAVILLVQLFLKIKQRAFLTDGVNYYFILFIISLCLIVSGAGFLAFDYPL